MLQGAKSQPDVTRAVQCRLNEMVAPSIPLGLQYAPAKSELIHLLLTKASSLRTTLSVITLGATNINNQETKKLLGITINFRLTFREQTSVGSSKAHNLLPFHHCMDTSRGASMCTVRVMVTTRLSQALAWGSRGWWTGARRVVVGLSPICHSFARLITAIPSYTRTDKHLYADGMPPSTPC